MLNTSETLTLLGLYSPLLAIILTMYISVFLQWFRMKPEDTSPSFSPEVISKINELDERTTERWLDGN